MIIKNSETSQILESLQGECVKGMEEEEGRDREKIKKVLVGIDCESLVCEKKRHQNFGKFSKEACNRDGGGKKEGVGVGEKGRTTKRQQTL